MVQRAPFRRTRAGAIRTRCASFVEPLERRYLMAGWSPVGPETLVNDTTAGIQETRYEGHKAVASDDNGRYVIVWSGSGAGDTSGVYARRYNASGPLGPSFQVNTVIAGVQAEPAVAMDNAGNFIVVWSSNGTDGSGWGVYGQRYDAAGNPLGGEFQVNVTTAGNQNQPSVAADADGDFVVTWTSANLDGMGLGIAGRRYNAAGIPQGAQFIVNSYTDGDQVLSAVAMDDAGNFTVVWQSDYSPTSSIGIFMQRYSAAGSAVGFLTVVNTTTNGYQLAPSIGMNGAGTYVVAWTSDRLDGVPQDGDGRGVFAQRYTSAGAKTGLEFGVNATTAGHQQYPSVAVATTGEFVIAWESAAQDGSGWGAYAREYTAAGVSIGAEFRLNTTTAGAQHGVAVAMVGGGDYVGVWSGSGTGDGDGVFLQRYEDLTPGVTVTPTTGLVTTEAGGTATFSVVLDSRPTANVTISIVSSDTTEGTVSTSLLTFTRDNWNVGQTVTVTGVNDALNDGNVAYTIQTGATSSSDTSYSGLVVSDVSVSNVDTTPVPNSPPTVTTTGAPLQYVENGGAVAVDAGVVVSDVNDSVLAGAVISLIGYVSGEDVLGYAGGGGIVATWDATTGTLTLSGSAAVAQYQAALRAVTYSNNSDNPSIAGRSVRFVVSDGQASSTPVSRALAVQAVNDPPVAAVESYAAEQGATLSVAAASGVLANDSDVDGGALSAVLVQQASNGTVQLFGNGSFTYTPAPGFWGTDQFVYSVSDGAGGTDTATVTVQIARAPGVTVTPTTGLVTSESGGTASFTVVLDRQPAAAMTIDLALSLAGEGILSVDSLLFNPANWSVPQSVTVMGIDDGVDDGDRSYTIVLLPASSIDQQYDGLDAPDVAITNTARPVGSPQPPVAVADAYQVAGGSVLTVPPAGVLANDTSSTGEAMRATLVRQATNGVVTLFADGSFVYTPIVGFAGTDRFTYAASDAHGSSPAEVTVVVEPPNPQPEPTPPIDDLAVPPAAVPPLPLPGDDSDSDEEVAPMPPPRVDVPVVVVTQRVETQDFDGGPPVTAAPATSSSAAQEAPVSTPAATGVAPAQGRLARRHSVKEAAADGGEAAGDDDPTVRRGDAGWQGGTRGTGDLGALANAAPAALMTATGPLATSLESMSRQLGAANRAQNATIRTVSQVAMAMTAGYVMWSLRGASLLASLVTSLPLWRSLDPLPILESRVERAKAKAAAKRRKADRRNNGNRADGPGGDDDDKLGAMVH